MTREPIFAHLIHEAGHGAEHLFDAFRPSHYHHNQHTATTPGAAVSLATIEQGIKTAVSDVIAHVKTFEEAVAPHLQGLADVADHITQSPLVQTVLAAVLSPEDEALIVSLVHKLDQGAHALAGPATPQPEPAAAMPAAAPA